MPSGKTHDRITSYASLALIPAAVAVSLSGQPITLETIGSAVLNGAIASLSCLVSGWWLSPDVDVKGYLDRRYGALQFIWSGYYWLCHLGKHYRVNGRITHRSYLSHSPIVGTASRLGYLAIPLFLVSGSAGLEPEAIALFIQAHSGEVIAGAIGLEVGSLVHIVSDWLWSELH